MKVNLKTFLISILGFLSSTLIKMIGGYDVSMGTLMIFMGSDVVLGVMVSVFFKNSSKSESGLLSSTSMCKGLLKKATSFIVIIVANRLDIQLGTNYIRNGVIMAYIFMEGISILENIKAMGFPIPEIIENIIEDKGVKKK